jgi:AbrB family looped-hinge helix DNA binding protein
MVERTKLSSKGQVIIPKDVREARGWREGEELLVENRPEGVLLRRRNPFKPTTLDEVIGSSGYRGSPISVEEMNTAVEKMFRREWRHESS